MKKLCVFGMLLLSTAAMAQYGTNGESGRYHVVKFPKYYVEQDQRTFAVNVDIATKKVAGYVDAEELAEKVRFKGWSKTPEDKAYLNIKITLGEFLYLSTEILDQSVDEKQKDGSVKRKPIYVGSFKYSFPITLSLTSPVNNDKYRLNQDGMMVKTLTYTDDHKFSTRADASAFMKENRDVLSEKVIRQLANEAAASAVNSAVIDYGFASTTEKASYVFLDSKKNPHYESQKNANTQLKEIFKTSSADEPISSDALTPIIEEYISIINELNDADKKQLKAKIELITSVAEFYLMLDDLASCETWAKRAFDEYKEKDGSKILEKAAAVKALFDKHHVTSRHFVPQAPAVEE
ncbi:MAG: hypothetical protein IKN94_04475 [Salinivirgaceae bacterium]|nr:hypothetical protein [Salinivirgaceae bacterium]